MGAAGESVEVRSISSLRMALGLKAMSCAAPLSQMTQGASRPTSDGPSAVLKRTRPDRERLDARAPSADEHDPPRPDVTGEDALDVEDVPVVGTGDTSRS
jgi:hypothetical protein